MPQLCSLASSLLLLLPLGVSCAQEYTAPLPSDESADTACRSEEVQFVDGPRGAVRYTLNDDFEAFSHNDSLVVEESGGYYETELNELIFEAGAHQAFEFDISSPLTDLFTTLQFKVDYRVKGEQDWSPVDITGDLDDQSGQFFGRLLIFPQLYQLSDRPELIVFGDSQGALKTNCELQDAKEFGAIVVDQYWNTDEQGEWIEGTVYEWRVRPFVKSGFRSLEGSYTYHLAVESIEN